uniref:Venom polypeptide n=1 Tax=Dolopus genitalis TaxID=2488630 RepID=A0A3G5BIC7_DOLGE|nr:venom polypeptide [Dolopus genitalis]
MKFFITLIFSVIALVSTVSAQWYVRGYCTSGCTVTNTLVCAWNGECNNMFKDNCQMKKWNCDKKDDFVIAPNVNCLISKQCSHIPAIIN